MYGKEGGRLERDLFIYWLGTEEILEKPDPQAQGRRPWASELCGVRGGPSCHLLPPSHSPKPQDTACQSPLLPSSLAGVGTNLWTPWCPKAVFESSSLMLKKKRKKETAIPQETGDAGREEP